MRIESAVAEFCATGDATAAPSAAAGRRVSSAAEVADAECRVSSDLLLAVRCFVVLRQSMDHGGRVGCAEQCAVFGHPFALRPVAPIGPLLARCSSCTGDKQPCTAQEWPCAALSLSRAPFLHFHSSASATATSRNLARRESARVIALALGCTSKQLQWRPMPASHPDPTRARTNEADRGSDRSRSPSWLHQAQVGRLRRRARSLERNDAINTYTQKREKENERNVKTGQRKERKTKGKHVDATATWSKREEAKEEENAQGQRKGSREG